MSTFNEAVWLAGIRPTERVIDLGCGDAADLVLAKTLVDRNLFTLAVDDTAQDWPTRLVARQVPAFHFIRANIRALPLASESFDVALIGWVMAKRGHWLEIFREVHRILRAEGRLLLTTPIVPAGRHLHRRPPPKLHRVADFLEMLEMDGFMAKVHQDSEEAHDRVVILARKRAV